MGLQELKEVGGIPKDSINQIILNYFIQEGFEKAALSFANEIYYPCSSAKSNSDSPISKSDDSFKDNKKVNSHDDDSRNLNHPKNEDLNQCGDMKSKIQNLIYKRPLMLSDYLTMGKRRQIKLLILEGNITEAISKISEHFPSVLDSNNLLHFKLLRLNLIEMIREKKLSSTHADNLEDEKEFLEKILSFVRDNFLMKISQSSRLLTELETTMSLLCFNLDPTKSIKDQNDLPEELIALFSMSLRNQCYRLVNRAILDLYRNGCTKQSRSRSKLKGNRVEREFPSSIVRNEIDTVEFNLVNYENLSDGIDDVELLDEIEDVDYNYSVKRSSNINEVSQNELKELEEQGTDDGYQTESEYGNLETSLERIIKLWTIAEQRLVDLRVQKEKEYGFLEKLL